MPEGAVKLCADGRVSLNPNGTRALCCPEPGCCPDGFTGQTYYSYIYNEIGFGTPPTLPRTATCGRSLWRGASLPTQVLVADGYPDFCPYSAAAGYTDSYIDTISINGSLAVRLGSVASVSGSLSSPYFVNGSLYQTDSFLVAYPTALTGIPPSPQFLLSMTINGGPADSASLTAVASGPPPVTGTTRTHAAIDLIQRPSCNPPQGSIQTLLSWKFGPAITGVFGRRGRASVGISLDSNRDSGTYTVQISNRGTETYSTERSFSGLWDGTRISWTFYERKRLLSTTGSPDYTAFDLTVSSSGRIVVRTPCPNPTGQGPGDIGGIALNNIIRQIRGR